MSKNSENKSNTGLSNNDKDPVCNNYDLNAVTFGKNAFKKIWNDKVHLSAGLGISVGPIHFGGGVDIPKPTFEGDHAFLGCSNCGHHVNKHDSFNDDHQFNFDPNPGMPN